MYSLENTRFFLEFTENNRIEIAEPTGFDGSHFTLLQENGRMGRDVAFSGETLEFNPTVNIEGLTHQFDTLIQYYDNKGFEGEILFIINIKGVDYVIGQLDFTNAETDRIKYLRCSLIQDTKQAIIKRHLQTNVDLYSDKDITGNIEITPLVPKKIFLPALPLKQSSEWDIPESKPVYGWFDYTNIIVTLNPFNFITKVAIEDTLSPTTDANLHPDTVADRFANMEVLRAVNSLSDIVVKFIDCNWVFEFALSDWDFNLAFTAGIDPYNRRWLRTFNVPKIASNYNLEVTLPPVERGETLYMIFQFETLVSGAEMRASFNSGKMEISSTTTAVSSVTDAVRLGDAFRQVIKSISGGAIDAPLFNANADLYNQFIFQGNQLRQVKDKPFNMTLEKLLKYLPEINGDYEVTPDGNVFIGVEKDFYTNDLCGSFIISPNATFRETFNDKYKVNKLEFKYSKYEDGNNEEEADSLLSVHTEAQYLIQNKQVENTKNIQVDFVRCAYLLEKTRKRNVLVTNNAAKSEDDTTFVLDCIAATETSIQTFVLRHFIDENNLLKLTNDGTFDFTTIGLVGAIVGGSTVLITEGENQGTYTCYEVTTYYIVLGKTDAPPADFTGTSLTTIVFTPNAQYKAKTDQDVSYSGIGFPTANMRFNIRQNVLYYYNQYLWTAHKYNNAEIMKTSFFKNGSTVYIRYNPEPIGSGFMNQDVERNRFAQGLVTPKIIETEVITDFSKFWECITDIREKRGYIEIEDTDGSIKKIFPIEMNYNWKDFLLTIKGEEKWK